MSHSKKHRCSVSHIVDKSGRPCAFAVCLETGESIHIRPEIVEQQNITRKDIGETFWCFAATNPGKSALSCTAFIEWDDDGEDEVERLRADLAKALATIDAIRAAVQ